MLSKYKLLLLTHGGQRCDREPGGGGGGGDDLCKDVSAQVAPGCMDTSLLCVALLFVSWILFSNRNTLENCSSEVHFLPLFFALPRGFAWRVLSLNTRRSKWPRPSAVTWTGGWVPLGNGAWRRMSHAASGPWISESGLSRLDATRTESAS